MPAVRDRAYCAKMRAEAIPRPLFLALCGCAALALTGCASGPGASARAGWPVLIPLRGAIPDLSATTDPAAEVDARAARLRARASALQAAP